MANTIFTHSGIAHMDEFLACCLIIAKTNGAVDNIERIESMDGINVGDGDWVIDIGGEHDPERLRFDHHQFDKEDANFGACAFSLVAKHFGMDDVLRQIMPWYETLEMRDNFGPSFVETQYKIPRGVSSKLQSPIEGLILQQFAAQPNNAELHAVMRGIGNSIIEKHDRVLEEMGSITMYGVLQGEVTVMDFSYHNRVYTPETMNLFCKRKGIEPDVIISKDDRGNGASIFRTQRGEFNGVDLNVFRDDAVFPVSFVHRSGFIVKTPHPLTMDQRHQVFNKICDSVTKAA